MEKGKGRSGPSDLRNSLQHSRKNWRRGSESNRRIEVLQTSALPLGYRALTNAKLNLRTQILLALAIFYTGFLRFDHGSGQSKKKWERTNVTNLLRNGQSGTYYARVKVNGKEKWRTLKTKVFSVAKLKLGLEDTARMSTPESASFSQSANVVAAPAVAPEPLTYSVAEAALALGVSAPTIYRLITRRILRPLDCLRHKRIPKRQVDAPVSGSGSGHP
jgi:excisionase family DNA binding protein